MSKFLIPDDLASLKKKLLEQFESPQAGNISLAVSAGPEAGPATASFRRGEISGRQYIKDITEEENVQLINYFGLRWEVRRKENIKWSPLQFVDPSLKASVFEKFDEITDMFPEIKNGLVSLKEQREGKRNCNTCLTSLYNSVFSLLNTQSLEGKTDEELAKIEKWGGPTFLDQWLRQGPRPISHELSAILSDKGVIVRQPSSMGAHPQARQDYLSSKPLTRNAEDISVAALIKRYSRGMRAACPICSMKHLSSALALYEEADAYPEHVYKGWGQLEQAESEIRDLDPELADLIRGERKLSEDHLRYKPRVDNLMREMEKHMPEHHQEVLNEVRKRNQGKERN